MVWAPIRENSWGVHPIYPLWWQFYNIFLSKSDHSITHAGLSALVHTNTELIYLHPVTLIPLIATQYYPLVTDIPQGLDQTLFPLPQTNRSRQRSASSLPGTQHSPFNTWEYAKQTGTLQARSQDSHWIPSTATRRWKMDPKWKPRMQNVMSSEEGDKLHSPLKGHVVMCFHCLLLTESQSSSMGNSQINFSKSLFLP